jgi:hypothetical protein
MKYKNIILFYAGPHSFTKFLFQIFTISFVKQTYYENVGYNIKHDDGLYNAFLPAFKWLYIFSLMIVDI